MVQSSQNVSAPETDQSSKQISELISISNLEESIPETIPEPEPIPEPISLPTPIQISSLSVEPVPIQTPVQTPAPITPTLIVETEPSVRFTSYDQVIQQRGNTTHFDYVEKNRDSDSVDEEDLIFQDDDAQSLSSFEDLTEYNTEPLGDDDFETI